MASYTKLSAPDFKTILQRYQLTYIGHESIAAGQGNSNYFINTVQGKFVLTMFETTIPRAQTLCKTMSILADHKFPTSRIHHLPNGKPLTIYNGKAVVLKLFIEGVNIRDFPNNTLEQIGTAIAHLHKIPGPDYLPTQHLCERFTLPIVLNTGSPAGYKEWLEKRNHAINTQIPTKLPRTLIHGDIFFDNVLVRGNQFTAIIDFEEACHHYRVLDLGMAIVGTCKMNAEIDLAKAGALIAGYQTGIRLTPDERQLLQSFTEYAALLTSAWRYWKYHVDSQGTTNASTYLEMAAIAKFTEKYGKEKFTDEIFGYSKV